MTNSHRNITYFIKDVKQIQFCGQTFFEFTGGKFEIPFETKSAPGEHNLENCENCKAHKALLVQEINAQLEKFPFCCEHHRRLINFRDFKKDDYSNIADSTANKIMYSYHHILNYLDTDDWKKEIKDYINYTIESYGSFPEDYGEPFQLGNYFNCTLHLLEGAKTYISSTKIDLKELNRRWNYIINYIKILKSGKTKSFNTDLNILLQTYNSWLNIFPFELNAYFGNLKEKFERQIPILTGKPEINKYSGLTTAKLHTKDSLIDALVDLTNKILTEINGVTLYENGLISDANKLKIDLIIGNRKLKLKKGYTNNSKTEDQRYRKILKEWFKDEKEFINELLPALQIEKANQDNSSELAKNLHQNIFSTDFGFTLFLKLHENYKMSPNHLANYSFIYYALQNDSLIVCSGAEFKRFLAQSYDIHVDKIDSRQFGENTKYKMYTAIKETLKNKSTF